MCLHLKPQISFFLSFSIYFNNIHYSVSGYHHLDVSKLQPYLG